ncbi:unnamed protein product [Durusdinium trenchii]|uniref:Pseudouridine synthase RsuA/RluA-like domain-containing protein n=1 Tax=Durusdinium trenchii TaxID=1381693 RepID=A0ABP0IFA1_9DINO
MISPARPFATLRHVQKDAVQPTLFHYNSALSSCKESSDWGAALSLLTTLGAVGLGPSSASFTAAIRAVAQTRRLWEVGLTLLCDLHVWMLQSNQITNSAALTAAGRSTAWQAAVGIFSRMQLQELCQDVVSHTAALAACEPSGRWQLMLELFAKMPVVDVVACGAAVSACAKAASWQEALLLLVSMPKQRLWPNTICFNATISACERSGHWELALFLLNEMDLQALQPDAVSVSAAISACGRGLEWQAAMWLLATLPSMHLQRTTISFNATMSACEKAKHWQHVTQLTDDFVSHGFLPDTVTRGVIGLACDHAEQWQRSLLLSPSKGPVSKDGLQTLARRLSWSEDERAEVRAWLQPEQLKEVSPDELVLLVWCAASLGWSEENIIHRTRKKLLQCLQSRLLSWRETSRLAWSLANLEVNDAVLLDTLQEDLIQQMDRFESAQHSGVLLDFASSALTTSWACSFLKSLRRRTLGKVSEFLAQSALLLDRQPVPNLAYDLFSDKTLIHLELEDLLVISKPPHWQVDSNTDRNSEASLGDFLKGIFPVRRWPVFRDTANAKGFLHRLDVPSSGLILVAKTYSAYFDLRLQLQTGQMHREYLVLSHGWLPPRGAVVARVHALKGGRSDQSSVTRRGRVAITRLKVLSYCMLSGAVSLVAVRLVTGRMHQIRLHLSHIGHPTVTDGKYAATETKLRDEQRCSRNFLHRPPS